MKLTQIGQFVFIGLASVGVYSFVRAAQHDHRRASCTALCELRPDYAAQNRSLPNVELADRDGNKVRLSSFLAGNPMVINFWTKTCAPCLQEMPMLAQLAGLLKQRGVPLVTVCTDDGPDAVRDTLKVALQGKDPPFPILFDPDAEIVNGRFGTTLYPETWFVDPDGVIRARVDGARDWSGATGSFALEVVEMISRPSGCPVEFLGREPKGPYASLCGGE